MTTTHELGELVRTAGSTTAVGALVTESRTVTLSPGAVVGFTVDPTRWCLGRRSLDGDDVPCPDGAVVARGRQCHRCSESDPWRWLHIVHRSQYPPEPGLREHVMRPHWLYVATFAGGAHKVGTAVDDRKQARLDEQGALVAHWIGLAEDGIVVREWEDRVSTLSGIGQVVRPAAKVAGLAGPVAPAAVVRQHEQTVARARQTLADLPGAEPLAEPWPNPRDPETLTRLTLRPYPGTLDQGRHGFTVEACWGPVGLVRLDGDPDSTWAVDLSALVGHRIRFGDHVTEVPQLQDSLF